MALTAEERDRCRYHLGYLSVSPATALSYGLPVPVQTLFILENAMTNLLTVAEERVRFLLGKLDEIEEVLFCSVTRLAATRLGDIEIRDNEPLLIEQEYDRWAQRLAEVFGAPRYPYSARTHGGGAGAAGNAGNIPVRNS